MSGAKPVKRYGSWPSPITADALVQRVVGLSQVTADGDTVLWNELRPADAGRQVVVRRSTEGTAEDAVPAGMSVRTLVHEYGGLCYAARDGTLFFSNFVDQRLWRLDPGGSPVAITPDPPAPRAHRFADPVVSPDGRFLVCVQERHESGEVTNDVVVVAADGSGAPRAVAGGHDFFAAPRLSPDGRRLAWLAWDHPNMPWDGTELLVADFDPERGEIGEPRLVAGSRTESVSQPRWSPDGRLHFASDRTGWWNLYADDRAGRPRALAARDAEFSGPDWVFGQSTYVFLPDGTIVTAWWDGGVSHVGRLAPDGGLEELALPYTTVGSLAVAGGKVVAVAGSPSELPAVVAVDPVTGDTEVLARSSPTTVDPAYLSVPRAVEFPTTGGRTAHAFFYPPVNGDVSPPGDELPPLVVVSHGGPTGATVAVLSLAVQFWTSRGIAVVDVNYGGSTGFGRAYRQQLDGQWGVVDVDDCVNAARWLADQGEVDGRRLAIRGGSAGGYTTLCALAFRDVFAVGASHFGVADAAALARDTHKFESRYLDRLIGPYPEAEARYRERSPLFFADRISCPAILFQGLEDAVVPPDQAEEMVAALRKKGVPVAYVPFEGEQHGFRKAENIKRTAEVELWFFGQALGFEPSDDIEPVHVDGDISATARGTRR